MCGFFLVFVCSVLVLVLKWLLELHAQLSCEGDCVCKLVVMSCDGVIFFFTLLKHFNF